MSAEPTSARPMDVLYQNVWFWLFYLLFVVFEAAAIATVWSVLGPANLWCAGTVVGTTWGLTPALCAPAVLRRVPARWLRVPARERVVHRVLGIGVFGWLLEASGWNRRVAERLRAFSRTRAGLRSLEQGVRSTAAAHSVCFAIHILLAIVTLFSGHALRGALWMLLPGVAVHLYPVLLQRSILLRLQPSLEKTGRS